MRREKEETSSTTLTLSSTYGVLRTIWWAWVTGITSESLKTTKSRSNSVSFVWWIGSQLLQLLGLVFRCSFEFVVSSVLLWERNYFHFYGRNFYLYAVKRIFACNGQASTVVHILVRSVQWWLCCLYMGRFNPKRRWNMKKNKVANSVKDEERKARDKINYNNPLFYIRSIKSNLSSVFHRNHT